MQPNESLSTEERIAELEEASMLIIARVHHWVMIAEEERPAAVARLAYLMQRMQDRLAAKEVARLRADLFPKVTVTEDSEL